MQHYEPVFYEMFRHPCDTPTFKSNALRLVSDEGWVKCLLPLHKGLIQPRLCLLWLYVTGNAFHHFHPHDTPTFKTTAFRLVSNKGW